MKSILSIRNLSVVYPGVRPVTALENVNLEISAGEFVVVAGVSGSGKSTLLRAINRLVENDRARVTGSILFDGKDVLKASRRELRELRSHIGFIFQEYNVVERLSVLTNALTGTLATVGTWSSLLGRFPKAQVELAHRALERVGIPLPRHGDRAARLSGGQKQRVGIARALMQKPRLILADEPVASLDPITANIVMNIFKKINEEEGITTIINLHDPVLTFKYGKRIVGLKQGRVIYDKPITAINRETFEEDIYGSGDGA
ncbi:MAG: phosphonate ABC transporter ATP-binding protein [Candidatus Bipolaricaulota bacterium]|nr:phosphonate ABC transporter ATP-binding protein [Candidatus Bipolaricaulota bacterium]MCS7274960.1 phosphonate ABC transporter ATP-binding protein [Candidatus Bipolaricaulota bacterium]MDW8110204.1 phosphonate ABC transporter ATP-binding protein [Candidatus Bipolaricaulota bacterium]MDW8329977.1 phosphonate ABC transporter ATP-binding protein [Candidatus Bipolaricaulota bacterium]